MKRLSSLFIVTILICLIISITLTTLVTSSGVKASIRSESQQLLLSIASKSADEMDLRIKSVEDQLSVLSQVLSSAYSYHSVEDILLEHDTHIRSINQNNQHVLASYLVFNPDLVTSDQGAYPYQTVYVKDPKGQVVLLDRLATYEDFQSQDAYMTWYRAPLEKKQGVWSDVYYDEFIEMDLITYSAPVMYEGQVIAIVGIDIAFEEFKTMVNAIKVYQSGYAFLLSEDYDYLIHHSLQPHENLSTIEFGRYAHMAKILDKKDQGIIEYYFDDADKLMAYKRLSNGWILAVAPVYDEVYAVYRGLSLQRLYIIGIGILISIIIAFMAGKLVSRPLVRLTQQVNKAKDQTHYSPLEVTSNIYEVQVLYESINNLRQGLDQAFKSMNDQNQDLEDLVNKRTLALRKANTELSSSLDHLQAMQGQLVEAEKEKEVASLVKNIAYSINSPLGNAITTHSYLKHILEAQGNSQALYESMAIIESAYANLRHIVDGLHVLTMEMDTSFRETTPIRSLIESRFAWIKGKHPNRQLDLNLTCPDRDIMTNKPLVTKVINSLLEISLDISRGRHAPHTINLLVDLTDTSCRLSYRDNAGCNQHILDYLQAPSTITGDLTHLNLDMSILKTLVEKGLSGQFSHDPQDEMSPLIISFNL